MHKSLQRNHVVIENADGRPMILSHGFGCDQTVWEPLRPYLGNNFKIITYDLVGAGLSDKEAYDERKYNDLQGYAQDLLEIIDALRLQDVIYVGHSVSAMIGCLAAVDSPKSFSRLVLMAPSPCYQNIGDYKGGFSSEQLGGLLATLNADLTAWSQQVAPIFMGNADRPELAADLCQRFCRLPPKIAAQFAEVVFMCDYRDLIPRVTTPTLILQCHQDVVAPEFVGEYMHRAMPFNSLKVLPATGHFPHVSAPAQTADAILQYLNKSVVRQKRA